MKQKETNEVTAYCSNCQKGICKFVRTTDTLSDSFFLEMWKPLIQYFPIIDISEKAYLIHIHVDANQ